MNRLAFFSILILITICISINANTVLKSETQSGFTLEFSCPEPLISNSEKTDFFNVDLQNAGISGEIGGPNLPVYRFLVQIPQSGEIELNVLDFESEEISVDGLPYPRQLPVFKNRPKPDFKYDSDKYSHRSNSQIAEIEELGIIRGYRLGVLTVYPLSFDRENSCLMYRSNVEIEVEFSSPIEAVEPRLESDRITRMLDRTLVFPTEIDRSTDFPAKYLIISTSTYVSALSDFVILKEQQGYDVELAFLDSIGTSETEIATYIEDAYLLWDNPPDYVLMVGDIDDVPPHEYSAGWDSHPSDQYYMMVDGSDYLPDIACGRFSVESIIDLEAIIDKTISHARFDFHDTDWLSHVVLPACGTDGDYELAMGTHRYCIDNYLHSPDFDVDSIFAYFGGTSAEMISSINEGATVVNYSGHGSETGWSNPSMEVDDIPSLTNDGKCPLVISNACLTNKFDHSSTCFGEAWTREPDAGAIAFIGGSNSTLWDEDDWWQRAVYDAIFMDGYWTVASLMFMGCLEVELRGSSESEYYFQIYHVMGDPSLGNYWGVPDPISATVPDAFPMGMSEMEIPAPESTVVSIWIDENHKSSAYSIGGMATLFFDPVPTAGDSAMLSYFLPNFYQPIWQIVPAYFMADVSVEPGTLNVSEPGSILVTVRDTAGLPFDSVTVMFKGFAVDETLLTDTDGRAIFYLTPEFGETLAVYGQRPDGGMLFRESVVVISSGSFDPVEMEISSPDAHVTDSLAVGMDGEISITMPSSPFSWRLSGTGMESISGYVASSESITIEITPDLPIDMVLQTAADGLTIGRNTIQARICRGDFDGVVTDSTGSTFAVGMEIMLYSAGTDTSLEVPVCRTVTDDSGAFNVGLIRAGYYDIYLRGFGWIMESREFTHHIDGDYHILANPAATTSLSGTVTDTSGNPIMAEIILSNPDGTMLASTYSDSNGIYSIDDLPYFDYGLHVSARGYSPIFGNINIESTPEVDNIEMEPLVSHVLVISNGGGSDADQIESHLWDFGLICDRTSYIPGLDTLKNYEFIVYSTGGNSDGAYNSIHAEKLLAAHRAGVKLLTEGGEIGWSYYDEAPQLFVDSLLRISDWEGDDPDSNLYINIAPPRAYSLAHNPQTPDHTIQARSINPWWDYEFFDIIIPGNANILYHLAGTPNTGCVSYFSDSTGGGVHRSAHIFFKYEDAFTTTNANKNILRNIAEWLRAPDYPNAILLGKARVLSGDPMGIEVNGGSDIDTTQSDGRFRLVLPPGNSSIIFSAAHIQDTTYESGTLQPGEITGERVFMLMMFDNIGEIDKPDRIRVENIYPNPFNQAVCFSVFSPNMAWGKLSIYNVMGKLIHSEDFQIDGEKKLIWNTEENFSSSSGIYLYKVDIGEESFSGKMLMVK